MRIAIGISDPSLTAPDAIPRRVAVGPIPHPLSTRYRSGDIALVNMLRQKIGSTDNTLVDPHGSRLTPSPSVGIIAPARGAPIHVVVAAAARRRPLEAHCRVVCEDVAGPIRLAIHDTVIVSVQLPARLCGKGAHAS